MAMTGHLSLYHLAMGSWWHVSLNDLIVGGGTFVGTVVLACVVAWQAVLQRRQMARAEFPTVVPAPSPAWTRKRPPYDENEWAYALPVANLGPGSAFNVAGELRFAQPDPSGSQEFDRVGFIPTNIAAGTTVDLVIDWNREHRQAWVAGSGVLYYEDSSDRLWETNFNFSMSGRRAMILFRVTGIQESTEAVVRKYFAGRERIRVRRGHKPRLRAWKRNTG
jgi:hypothetical protein